MNWEQAKTILIVAFLGLNLYLGFLVWEQNYRHPTGAALTPTQEVAAVEQRLEEAGVELEAPIPREAPNLALLRLKIAPLEARELAEDWFDGLDDVEMARDDPEEGTVSFSRDGALLEMEPGGVLNLRDPTAAPEELDAAAAEEWAEGYARWAGKYGQDLELEAVRPAGEGAYRLEFRQYAGQHPLVGHAGARAELEAEGGLELWQRWLKPLGAPGEAQPVIPATEALLRLLTHWQEAEEGADRTIDEIILGYYNNVYDAREWESVPVWAVRAQPGDWYYINAFTGEMES